MNIIHEAYPDDDAIEEYEEWHEKPISALPLIECALLKEGICS